MRDKLRVIIEESDTKAGRNFDLLVQLLVLISLISFSIETLPSLNSKLKVFLGWVETITILLFTLEYVARVWVSKKTFSYIFSFYGLVDFISFLPYYLMLAVDLRSLRTLRFIRLFRILKLARFSSAMQRFQKAIKLAKEEIILFLFATMIVLYLSSVGIYYFENEAQPEAFASVFHSLWWSVATLTTVGYGDVYPVTLGGKIFTFIILMVGLGIVGIPAGLVASSLSAIRREEEKEREEK